MRKIKDAITDSAIANGYEGNTPMTIAQAVGAFAGVAGGGSGGGGSNVIVVPWEENVSDMTITLGMTVNEIAEAMRAGKVVVIDLDESTMTNGVCQVSSIYNYEEDSYEIGCDRIAFSTFDGPDSYPGNIYND